MHVDGAGVRLWISEHGPRDGPLVVLLHGFPELGFSWRHQVGPLAEAGFRLVVPDLRGFGRSDAPDDVAAYAVPEHARDVLALLDRAGVEQAVVVGGADGVQLLAGPDGAPRPAEERDSATLATTVLAAQAGAWGVRVHDAAASVDALRTLDAVRAARGARRG